MSTPMLGALFMIVAVMGHTVTQQLDSNLYPFQDQSREVKFRSRLDKLKHLVEDDGQKKGILDWHQPEYQDASPSPYVQPWENQHASSPSDPFTKYTKTDPNVVRFAEKSSHTARLHKPTILPHAGNTVFAETKATRDGLAAEAETEAQAGEGAQAGDQIINLGSVLGAVGKVASAVASALAPTQAKPEDVEDCVACRYVWLQVEMDVGNSQIESNIYDSFKAHCRDAQLSRIFFPACQDMFDAVDDMIGDYMDGFTVNQMCENSRICR
jgi:hypothetical protein